MPYIKEGEYSKYQMCDDEDDIEEEIYEDSSFYGNVDRLIDMSTILFSKLKRANLEICILSIINFILLLTLSIVLFI